MLTNESIPLKNILPVKIPLERALDAFSHGRATGGENLFILVNSYNETDEMSTLIHSSGEDKTAGIPSSTTQQQEQVINKKILPKQKHDHKSTDEKNLPKQNDIKLNAGKEKLSREVEKKNYIIKSEDIKSSESIQGFSEQNKNKIISKDMVTDESTANKEKLQRNVSEPINKEIKQDKLSINVQNNKSNEMDKIKNEDKYSNETQDRKLKETKSDNKKNKKGSSKNK